MEGGDARERRGVFCCGGSEAGYEMDAVELAVDAPDLAVLLLSAWLRLGKWNNIYSATIDMMVERTWSFV